MEIKIGFISDLHGLQGPWSDNLKGSHWGWEIEQQWNDMDLVIFGGDCSGRGGQGEIDTFMNWFNLQPGEKVMIAGNHDFFFDYKLKQTHPRHSWQPDPEEAVNEMLAKYPDITYLDDSGVEMFGLKIWGSPIQPWFHDWAFNRFRNTHIDVNGDTKWVGDTVGGIKPHWDVIPDDIDILITHGPPFMHGDGLCSKFEKAGEFPHVGCADLMNRIKEIKPKISVFGHIHEGYGITEDEHTTYINASCLNENYKPVNAPIFKTIEV